MKLTDDEILNIMIDLNIINTILNVIKLHESNLYNDTHIFESKFFKTKLNEYLKKCIENNTFNTEELIQNIRIHEIINYDNDLFGLTDDYRRSSLRECMDMLIRPIEIHIVNPKVYNIMKMDFYLY